MTDEKKPAKETKVDRETALVEFERFTEAYELDIDLGGDSGEDSAALDMNCRRVIKAIMVGRATVDGDGVITVHTVDNQDVVFEEPNGSAYGAMDKHSEKHTMGRTRAFLAAITHRPPVFYGKMVNRDKKVCMAIMALFLA